jgi:hypothetical protein
MPFLSWQAVVAAQGAGSSAAAAAQQVALNEFAEFRRGLRAIQHQPRPRTPAPVVIAGGLDGQTVRRVLRCFRAIANALAAQVSSISPATRML